MREHSAVWTDHELIERMRADDRFALREFFWRFKPMLLEYAKTLGVQQALREEMALDTLDDAMLALMPYTRPVPRSLPGYLVTALRHRVAGAARADRHRGDEHGAGHPADASDGDVLRASSSESSARAGEPAWAEAPRLSPALERLASALDDGLSEEERNLLSWVAHWVPQRLIAEWIGVSHGALRIRVLRLRERLREAAVQYAMQASAEEQMELRNFFRRTALLPRSEDGTGASDGSARASLAEDSAPLPRAQPQRRRPKEEAR